MFDGVARAEARGSVRRGGETRRYECVSLSCSVVQNRSVIPAM